MNTFDTDFRLETIKSKDFIILPEGGAGSHDLWPTGSPKTTSVWISFVRNNGRLYFILMRLCNFDLKEETGNDLNCVEQGSMKSC